MSFDNERSGPAKAAALLVALGPEAASEILRNLSEDEVERISTEIARIDGLSIEEREDLLGDFLIRLRKQSRSIQAGRDVARGLLDKAFGSEKSSEIIERFDQKDINVSESFSFLKEIESDIIVELLKNEHPQIIALVVNYLTPAVSGELMKSLDKELSKKVALRIARMKEVVPDSAVRVAKSLKERYKQYLREGGRGSSHEGFSSLVNIIQHLPGEDEKRLMNFFDSSLPDLSMKIRERVFAFESLMGLSNTEIRILIDELSNDRVLSVALKGAEDELRVKILRNMSQNRATDIIQNIEIMGPMPLREIEEARRFVVQIMRELHENGAISLRKGDDIYIE